ncbi:MAG: hypothetical protein IJZ38_12910 [Bacteroides sp.]|nr:hypothetical protein [Bacteroides sp.]
MQSTARAFLFFILGTWRADGDVRVAPFFLEASSEIIMATVYGAGTAGTFYEIMTVLGFNLIAADVAVDVNVNEYLSQVLANI